MFSIHHFFNDISNIFILLRSIPGKKTCISVFQIKTLSLRGVKKHSQGRKATWSSRMPLRSVRLWILYSFPTWFVWKWRSSQSLSISQFSSVMSDSLWPHELQHARPPCPSPTPGVYSNSCPSSQRCHPAISSSVVPFSSCPQFLPASGSFPMSQLFAYCHVNWCS